MNNIPKHGDAWRPKTQRNFHYLAYNDYLANLFSHSNKNGVCQGHILSPYCYPIRKFLHFMNPSDTLHRPVMYM